MAGKGNHWNCQPVCAEKASRSSSNRLDSRAVVRARAADATIAPRSRLMGRRGVRPGILRMMAGKVWLAWKKQCQNSKTQRIPAFIDAKRLLRRLCRTQRSKTLKFRSMNMKNQSKRSFRALRADSHDVNLGCVYGCYMTCHQSADPLYCRD